MSRHDEIGVAAGLGPYGKKQGALRNILTQTSGSVANADNAIAFANQFSPIALKADPWEAAFQFFAEMGKQASVPGSTALGAAVGSMQAPMDYLNAKNKERRDSEAARTQMALTVGAGLKGPAGKVTYRPATATELEEYGATVGQFDSNGRFYDLSKKSDSGTINTGSYVFQNRAAFDRFKIEFPAIAETLTAGQIAGTESLIINKSLLTNPELPNVFKEPPDSQTKFTPIDVFKDGKKKKVTTQKELTEALDPTGANGGWIRETDAAPARGKSGRIIAQKSVFDLADLIFQQISSDQPISISPRIIATAIGDYNFLRNEKRETIKDGDVTTTYSIPGQDLLPAIKRTYENTPLVYQTMLKLLRGEAVGGDTGGGAVGGGAVGGEAVGGDTGGGEDSTSETIVVGGKEVEVLSTSAKPLSSTTASSLASAEAAATNINEAFSLLFPGGVYDKDLKNLVAAPNILLELGSSKARSIKQYMERAIEAFLKMKTGATAPAEEVIKYTEMYSPTLRDTEADVRAKFSELGTFFATMKNFVLEGNTGQLPEIPNFSGTSNAAETPTVVNSEETGTGQKVMILTDGTVVITD